MNDQYQGQGGSYAINEQGERVLLARTREAGETINTAASTTTTAPAPPAPDSAPAAEAVPDPTPARPAKAGFFTPAAKADPTTTTE